MTFEGYFGDLLTVVVLCVQLTRDLLVIAKFFCKYCELILYVDGIKEDVLLLLCRLFTLHSAEVLGSIILSVIKLSVTVHIFFQLTLNLVDVTVYRAAFKRRLQAHF